MASVALCEHCKGPNAPGSARCVHCGCMVKQKLKRDADTPITCPVCMGTCDLVWLATIQVDLCPHCSGIWFDDDELARLPRTLADAELAEAARELLAGLPTKVAAKVAASTRSSYLRCPLCDGHMSRKNYRETSGILTDRCDGCGTWVDRSSGVAILKLLHSPQLFDVERRAANKISWEMNKNSPSSVEWIAGELMREPRSSHYGTDTWCDAVALLLDIVGFFS